MAPQMPHRESRARAAQALQLRARRKTWAEISTTLGFRSRDGARLAVGRLVRSMAPDLALERAVATEALRVQEAGLYGRFEAAVDGGDDDMAVSLSKELRSLVAERAKLNGLAVPQRTELDVNVHHSATAIIDRMEGELLALAARQTQPAQLTVIEGEVIG